MVWHSPGYQLSSETKRKLVGFFKLQLNIKDNWYGTAHARIYVIRSSKRSCLISIQFSFKSTWTLIQMIWSGPGKKIGLVQPWPLISNKTSHVIDPCLSSASGISRKRAASPSSTCVQKAARVSDVWFICGMGTECNAQIENTSKQNNWVFRECSFGLP